MTGIEPASSAWKAETLAIELHREVLSKVQRPRSNVSKESMTWDVGPWTLDVELVDPTGLKPAPHGLKGRCSVTRAPDQDTAIIKLGVKDSNQKEWETGLFTLRSGITL